MRKLNVGYIRANMYLRVRTEYRAGNKSGERAISRGKLVNWPITWSKVQAPASNSWDFLNSCTKLNFRGRIISWGKLHKLTKQFNGVWCSQFALGLILVLSLAVGRIYAEMMMMMMNKSGAVCRILPRYASPLRHRFQGVWNFTSGKGIAQ